MNTYRKINVEIVGFCTSFSLLFKKIIKKLGGQWWQHLCTFRIFVIVQISNEQKVAYYFYCNIVSGKKKGHIIRLLSEFYQINVFRTDQAYCMSQLMPKQTFPRFLHWQSLSCEQYHNRIMFYTRKCQCFQSRVVFPQECSVGESSKCQQSGCV